MSKLPRTMDRLLQELQKLPGIGRKSGERIAFHLLYAQAEEAKALAQAIIDLKEKVHYCPECFNVTEEARCRICADPLRDNNRLCVVEQVMDLLAIEKSGAYNGVYHVLHGRLSPLEGITDADLRIRELEARLKGSETITEVILATTLGVEGETTATYLAQRLKPLGKKITRIGLGLPAGGVFEYADEITLRKALESRRPV